MTGFQGFDEVNRRFKELMQHVRSDMSERAITQCLITVGSYAATMTPIATSTLLNSQYRKVEVTLNRVTGEIGYGASYAVFVHQAPGKLMGTKTPRHPKSFGYVWDPDGEPGFLAKGVELMVENDLMRIVKGTYTV